MRRTYYVNGAEQPWSAASQTWLADNLPFLVRRSGVSAVERVSQIAEAKGVSAVLDEIRLLTSDAVRGQYFRALLATGSLDAAEADATLRLAADDVDSSLELGSILRTAVTVDLQDTYAFFSAARRISSSAETSGLLERVLEQSELSPARQVDLLAVAAAIESDAARADVLDAFITRHPHVVDPVRAALLAALQTVDSRVERERLRERVRTATTGTVY